jgi:hypothetical protein
LSDLNLCRSILVRYGFMPFAFEVMVTMFLLTQLSLFAFEDYVFQIPNFQSCFFVLFLCSVPKS